MASIYQPSGRKTYRIEFRDQHGGLRTISSGVKDKRVAQDLARKLEEDVQSLKVGNEPRYRNATYSFLGIDPPLSGAMEHPWQMALDAFLAEQKRQGISASYLQTTRSCLGIVQKWAGWRTLADVKPDQIGEFLREIAAKGRSACTQNHYRKYLRSFLGFCVEQGWMSSNPALKVKRIKLTQATRKRLRRALTMEELARLLTRTAEHETADLRARDHRTITYQVAAFAGFRRSEMLRLIKEDCSPCKEKPRWHVPEDRTKNGLPVDLPMTPECAEALADHWQKLPPGSPLVVSVPNMKTWRLDLKRAGIPYRDERGRIADIHSLRYTFCLLLSRQFPIEVVSKLMRHASIAQTADTYLELGFDRKGEHEWVLPRLMSTDTNPTTHPTAL